MRLVTAVHVVVPDAFDDPQRPSGGNVYDRRLCAELSDLGWTVHAHSVPGRWPTTEASAGRALAGELAAIQDGEIVIVDGIVGSAMPGVLRPEADRLCLVALVHLPLGSVRVVGSIGTAVVEGIRDIEAARAREQAVLERCRAVVATSEWSRRWLLERYSLPLTQVVVAPPGVDQAEASKPRRSGDRLLCVGAVTPVKGQDVLVEALSGVRGLDWTCTCVGAMGIEPRFAGSVAAAARRYGIAGRVLLRGPLSGADLHSAYANADLLVLPSRAETYGMVVAEALARGLPVVASEVGGVLESLCGRLAPPLAGDATDRVEERSSQDVPGLLVRPDDPAALAQALYFWLTRPELRVDLRRRAHVRRLDLVPWSATATRVSDVLTTLAEVPAGC